MSQPLTHSYYSATGGEPMLYRTIGDVFVETAERYGTRDALVVRHQNRRLSWNDYRHEVDRLAAGLLALDISPGDRVGIWAPNCVEWCLTQFATSRIGAIMVCLNPAYRRFELEHALNKVQCKAIITAERFKTTEYLEILRLLAPELDHCTPGELYSPTLPHLRHIIRTGNGHTNGMFRFDDVCSLGERRHYAALDQLSATLRPDDPINIQFTSGTTGYPKGATLTHCNILNNGKAVGDGMHLSADDRLCIPVPLYHCFGMVMGNLACLTHGSTAVLPAEGFDPGATLETIAAEHCTAIHGVPTMFIAELEHPEFERFDLTSLRTGIMAGSPCPVEVMKRVMQQMHLKEILIAYGQTETSPVNHMSTANDPVDKRANTVGKPIAHLEIKLVDDTGSVVAVGAPGEICVRGYSVMRGYWDEPERTAETIDTAGWLHSGDLGVMDQDGYVSVVGRIKDMIIRGGENVYPREIEEFLYTHPGIEDVQVFGIPDACYGELVCAWIRLKTSVEITDEEIRAFCRERITHFKVPYHIRFVETYPMTVTGKAQKFRMREIMVEELGLDLE